MTRTVLAFATGASLLVGVCADAQDVAQARITIKISARTPSFTNQRLVVMLYQDFPTQPDRARKGMDRHVNESFSHKQGADTIVTVSLGDPAKLDRAMYLSVNASVFTQDSAVTHVSEANGLRGPFSVLTHGAPDRLTLTLVPAQ